MRGQNTKSSPPTRGEHPSGASQREAGPGALQHPVNREHHVRQHLGGTTQGASSLLHSAEVKAAGKRTEGIRNRKWVEPKQ